MQLSEHFKYYQIIIQYARTGPVALEVNLVLFLL